MPSTDRLLSPTLQLPFPAPNHGLVQAGARLQANAARAVIRYQMEALSFLKRRCEADAKLVGDLADSKEFSDAFDIVSNFVQSANTDYMKEAARFASIGARLASETAKTAHDEAREIVEGRAAATAA